MIDFPEVCELLLIRGTCPPILQVNVSAECKMYDQSLTSHVDNQIDKPQ
jgi:hypothetical protein